MNKQELRETFLKKRTELSSKDIKHRSQLLAEMFRKNFDLTHIHVVHIFLPILSRNEIDTSFLIEEIRRHSHIEIVVPKVKENSSELETYLLKEDTKLVLNKWAIPEPENSSLVPEEKVDLILIPLLAFDKTGNRVGYGKGFYDRLLNQCRRDVIKVGLSFFEPVEKITDVESFDVPMNYCVTPERLYTF